MILGSIAFVIGWFALPLVCAYFIVGHALFGRTVGKLFLKLQVSDRDGRRIGWKNSALRFAVFAWGPIAWGALGGIVYFLHRGEKVTFTLGHLTARELWLPLLYMSIAAAIFLASLGGFILAAFHPEKRALHDLVAKSEVVHR
jgi:uncharacterized RDD family membrane protein YckC